MRTALRLQLPPMRETGDGPLSPTNHRRDRARDRGRSFVSNRPSTQCDRFPRRFPATGTCPRWRPAGGPGGPGGVGGLFMAEYFGVVCGQFRHFSACDICLNHPSVNSDKYSAAEDEGGPKDSPEDSPLGFLYSFLYFLFHFLFSFTAFFSIAAAVILFILLSVVLLIFNPPDFVKPIYFLHSILPVQDLMPPRFVT